MLWNQADCRFFTKATVSLLEKIQFKWILHNVGPFQISTFSPWSEASLDLFLQSHFTRAQANSPRPVMTSSGPNPKVSQGTLASQTQSQSQQSQLLVGQSHNSPGSSGREQREQRCSRSSRRKGSDSSVPEEDKDRREESVGKGEDKSTFNTDGILNVEHMKKQPWVCSRAPLWPMGVAIINRILFHQSFESSWSWMTGHHSHPNYQASSSMEDDSCWSALPHISYLGIHQFIYFLGVE